MINNISQKNLRCFVSLLLIVCGAFLAHATEYAGESVLSSGKWVRVRVSESGVYQLTRSTLSGMGFSDISKVKIYGYGGAMISERMGDDYVDDLPQLPVYSDGSKIVFYAQGPVSYSDSGSSNFRITRNRNPYSQYGYYFITDSDTETVAQEATGEAVASGAPLITDFLDVALHESEVSAPADTGRSLFGEDFRYTSSQTFTFDLTDKVPEKEVRINVNFFAKTIEGTSTINVSSDGTQVASFTVGRTSSSDNYAIGRVGSGYGYFSSNNDRVNLLVNYSNTGILSASNLDYILVNYFRELKLNRGSVHFRSFSSSCRDSIFSVEGSTRNTVVWDITTQYAPKKVNAVVNGSALRFRQTESGKREYVAFDPSATFPSPVLDGNVANQNLHGESAPTMVIITPAEFKTQAERLAELHRTVDNMKVAVVDQKLIFNEFSSGTPDVMAYRKLAKMWWERTKELPDSSVGRFRYMLLFGRSVFDNRKLSSEVRGVNYPLLLTWESDNSESQSVGFNTDDVFGILEDGSSVDNTSSLLNIAIGRMPVKSVDEAKGVVDKIYKYVNNPDPGSWKNNVIMIADDGDGGVHMDAGSEGAIANMMANGGEKYVYNRVYIDAFDRTSEGGGNTYPDAKKEMFRLFRNGALYASYVGHANTRSWTHNKLLLWEDIQNEFYLKHTPLLYTGTCEFTRWDSPEVSGGELLFLNEQGGMIGLITSSRATGISGNAQLSREIGNYLFEPDQYGEMRRIGDLVKDVKNARAKNDGGHRLKYALIGDPAIRLKYPKYNVVIDEINGQALVDGSETHPELKARQSAILKGHVEDLDGVKMNSMSGSLYSVVYDSQESVTTHGNAEGNDTGMELTYEEWSNVLYIGTDSLKNGEFEVRFKVPREINDNYRPGLISMYAYSEADNVDANGATSDFYVYGYDDTADSDTEGPEIRLLALNSSSFTDGQAVNETPYLLAEVYDESGINLSTAGVGHEITLLIDGKTTINNMESYYSQDSEQVGYINFQMDELSVGSHTLRLRVWDTQGNMSEKTISFVVEKGLTPQLYRVYSDANPAKTEANFYLEHDRPDALITVTISVYNLMGQEVWTNTSSGRSDMYLSMPVTWNLTDGTGRRVGRGIYLYRASITTDGENETTAAQRIAVAAE